MATTKLSSICAMASRFGVQAAAPVPRPGCPHLPFVVVKSDITPDRSFGRLEWRRDGELKTADLRPNDLILHLRSRVVARVVENLRPGVIRIEAWWPPECEEEMEAWDITKGKGTWVCWGQCFDDLRTTPKCLLPSHVTDNWDFFSREVHKYPERAMSMLERHPKAIKSRWKGMTKKQRRAARKRWNGILGKLKKVRDLSPESLDDYADKHAIAGKTRKEGKVEVTKFVLKDEED